MKERISAWAERFEAFSLRERVLIAVGMIAVLFMLWDALLLSPQEMEQRRIVNEMHGINQETATLTAEIQAMTAALQGGESAHIKTRMSELQTELGRLKQQQKELTIEFIRPVQMARVLRDMLRAEGGLRLARLESLGVEPLFPVEEGKQTDNEQKQQRTRRPEIFKHGLRIVFEGDYFKTLKYLRALEAMPWRLYWDNVEYQVLEYPKARVAITVHTLSLDEGWIGV
ncbi:MAG TPA: hypothetical protein ENI97_09115 [Gammaproteobacteria bacterium]|nr:hypothetical protein [Gammaproteobacteria bacterium]